jgi:hypothetical protein
MKKAGLNITLIFLCLFLLFFSSCFGVSVDIAFDQRGSGDVALEYRISKALDALGRLDGNERWNTIPAGKADFERTMDRLPGMKLTSFSSGEEKNDLIIKAKMEFKDLNSLMSFLDASGLRSSFSGDARSGRISLTLNEAGAKNNPALEKRVSGISESYSVKISMSFPDSGNLKMTDGMGLSLADMPGSVINSQGKKVSCSLPLYSVLSASEGINAEFLW